MPWLLRPPPTTGAERRGLKTRHRSRGVIRAGSSALFPLTPSRGSPTRLRRFQRHFARVARESKGEKLPLFCARTDVFATARATRARGLGAVAAGELSRIGLDRTAAHDRRTPARTSLARR